MTAAAEPHAADSPAEARGAHRGVVFSMCLALVLVASSMSALNLALPALALGLSASNTSLTWIVDGYTVALAGLVLPLGALGDRVGRRRVLVAGTVVFGAAALAASTAAGPAALVGCRVAMGLGAAMIMPGTLATMTSALPEEGRFRAVALWAGCAAAGVMIGMLASGALLEWFGWRSIFAGSAVAALGTAAAALLLAPETRDPRPRPFDAVGAVCTALAPGAFVYALIEGNDRGWAQPRALGALAVALLAVLVLAVHGLRAEHPLLDPRLLGVPAFRAGAVTLLVQFMAVFGFYFVGLQYVQLVLGYSPWKSAVSLVPVALVVVPTSQTTPTVAVYRPTAHPGARAPHVWLRGPDGRQVALADAIGDRFTVLTGPRGQAWEGAAAEVNLRRGLDVGALRIGPGCPWTDDDGRWQELYGVGPSGCVLVRPDGHVAMRRPDGPGGPAAAVSVLDRTLTAVLAGELSPVG